MAMTMAQTMAQTRAVTWALAMAKELTIAFNSCSGGTLGRPPVAYMR
jgi:hypothetical protein